MDRQVARANCRGAATAWRSAAVLGNEGWGPQLSSPLVVDVLILDTLARCSCTLDGGTVYLRGFHIQLNHIILIDFYDHFNTNMSDHFDWTSPEGLTTLRRIVEPSLPFTADDYQIYDSACILNGRDVACFTATGSGKTALIYIAALVDKDMISVVVEPTNLLEDDMVSLGLTTLI